MSITTVRVGDVRVAAELVNCHCLTDSIPRTPHTVSGKPGLYWLETRHGAIWVFRAASAILGEPTVMKRFEADDPYHQKIGRSDPAALIAIAIGKDVTPDMVERYVPANPTRSQSNF